MKRFTALAILLVISLLFAGESKAQNWRAAPLYGTAQLNSGFTPDPHTLEVVAGGGTSNPHTGPGCVGFIAHDQPDANIHYTARSTFDLTIYAESDTDTALLIRLPDGQWICNDDYDGLNPSITVVNASSGTYNVWVATYGSDSAAATLRVTELGHPRDRSGSSQPAVPCRSCEPYFGTFSLRAGFDPDPWARSIQAGGTTANPVQGDLCRGYVAVNAPDVVINYTAGGMPLAIFTDSEVDTTLLVHTPDGRWFCDDDGGRGLNALLEWDRPFSGRYSIWVGTHSSSNRGADATVYITELAPPR
jgi:hypothetical protein